MYIFGYVIPFLVYSRCWGLRPVFASMYNLILFLCNTLNVKLC